jgi:hypothetical protein
MDYTARTPIAAETRLSPAANGIADAPEAQP